MRWFLVVHLSVNITTLIFIVVNISQDLNSSDNVGQVKKIEFIRSTEFISCKPQCQ